MSLLLSSGLLDACDDPRLLGVGLWPRQRELLATVEVGPRMHVLALGRRAGKSTMAAIVCLWDCLLRPELNAMVRPGECRFAVAVATNLQQARLIVAAARSIVERSPALAQLVESATEDEVRFRLPDGSRTALRAFPCSSRGGRGWPVSTLVLDEAAHFLTETDGFQTAERVWQAMLPSTAQFGDEARVLVLSTPYGQRGLFADLHGRAAAGDLDGAIAQHATTAEMNPTNTPEFLAAEEKRDPDSFRAEFLAQFLGSGDAFIEWERVHLSDAPPAMPNDATEWIAGLDPAFSRDPFGLALVGRAEGSERDLVVGPVRALRPQGEFGPVMDEIIDECRRYRVRKVVTDQYSAAAVVDRLRKAGLTVEVNTMSAPTKTAIYVELRTRLYDGSLLLPDIPLLLAELQRLRTRFSAGSAAVTNPRVGGSHGDMAQALAMAVFEARLSHGEATSTPFHPWAGRGPGGTRRSASPSPRRGPVETWFESLGRT